MKNGRSSDEESEDGKFELLDERIREFVERIGGSEGGSGNLVEKRRNKGSSSEGDTGHKKWRRDGESWSEGDDGNRKWRWDGESWWYKVECRAAVNSRLRRRISRSVKATLEQEENRQRDGGNQVRLRSRIEWMEARKQSGSVTKQIEDEWGTGRYPGKGARFVLGKPVHVMLGLW